MIDTAQPGRDLLANLNPEQRDAVTHGTGPLLVLAGAGSGKTRVLTYRVAHLIRDRGVMPHRILAVTFTNKAAGEMAERVEHLLGGGTVDVWVSTFHAACVRILRRDGDRIGVPKNFVIYDDTDQMSLVKRLMKSLNIGDKDLPPRRFTWMLDQAKNRLIDPVDYVEGLRSHEEDRYRVLAHAYTSALREAGAVDFGDLLLLAYRLLSTEEEIARYYRERFEHILVDEFQDTNKAQYDLLRVMLGPEENLFVVGDDDQSIYSWRGARIANILDFDRDFPGVAKVVLTRNYRSTKNILDAASDVVGQNLDRNPKRLVTDNERGETITYYRAEDEYDEARFVVDRILALRRDHNVSNSDFAVFYRTNAQSRLIEDELRGAGLPYVVVGGTKFYDRKEVKDALGYLRVLENPADVVALLRVINVPKRGIGPGAIEKAGKLAEQWDVPLLEAIRTGVAQNAFAKQTLARFRDFVELIDRLDAVRDELPPSELLGEVLEHSGYLAMLQAEDSVESESRLENLEQLRQAVRQFELQRPGEPLADFLEQVTLISDPDLYDARADAVSLMTLHCAKGLEFPVVFLVGMEENLFPHSRAKNSETELEEERRLCYVGFTRARKRLFVTNATRRNVYGQPQFNPEARFLSDIHPNLLHVVAGGKKGRTGSLFDKGSTGRRPQASRPSAPKRSNYTQESGWDEPVWGQDRPEAPFPVGCRVNHARFGEGSVMSCSGKDENLKVSIRFDRGGVRTFKAAFAPIAKIGG